MKTQGNSKLDPNKIKVNQALNRDYEDTNYDRGHLNPNAFQCGFHRKATFTLTNAAPMDPCFNRIYWYKNEKTLKTCLTNKCVKEKGIPYLVTGTVPNNNQKIPDPDDDGESDMEREFSRVTVPSHIWTAFCCQFQDRDKTWSGAFLAENKPQSVIQSLPVFRLEENLKQLYHFPNLKIFAGNLCDSKTMECHLIMTLEEMALEKETTCEPPES